MKNIINILNFIRAVEPRLGRNIDLYKPVAEQIRIMKKWGLKGTFLLQYDTLCDEKMLALLQDIPQDSERGLWLETVQPQVEAAGLLWRGQYPWDWHNDVGFLIGYTPEERKKLIDVHMEKFRKIYGSYPAVAGSWHIDAFSIQYLYDKYHIKACCICRDQIGTDGYTMQGGYYNQAYYPSKNNMFCPAQTREMQIDVPVFRMLGSHPAFAYDYQLFSYDSVNSLLPTLEPAVNSVAFGKQLLEEIFCGSGLAFQYTQIGQENSFGWDKMCDGIAFQFEKVAAYEKEGKAEIMTLGEAGQWYKENFALTPAAAVISQKPWEKNNVRSYWYSSRFYRINVFAEDNILRIRDMYLFDENYPEHYLTQRCDSPSCEFRNLPVFDGALYSDKENGLRAGIYFCHGKEKIVWDEITYQEDVPGKSAKITLKKQNEYTVLRLFEQKAELTSNIKDLTLVPVYAADNVYGKKGTRDGTFANGNDLLHTKSGCQRSKSRFPV